VLDIELQALGATEPAGTIRQPAGWSAMEHPPLSTVPSSDLVFRRVVEWTIEEQGASSPDELTAARRPVFTRY
jgi:hypothetical protein